MNKPKIFQVSRTPKGLDNVLDISPSFVKENYCAVINVSDSVCATFDYQNNGIPSFWFPIHEIDRWGYPPFFGTLRVINEYYRSDKPILIHCHAGANRSPSVAYAILLTKGYTPKEAEESLQYEGLSKVFIRNIREGHIPSNIMEFLQKADESAYKTTSLYGVLRNLDSEYEGWSQAKYDKQNDYTFKSNEENLTRLIYNKDKKKFVVV